MEPGVSYSKLDPNTDERFLSLRREQARIRTQMSAAHSFEDIDRAIAAFVDVRSEIAG